MKFFFKINMSEGCALHEKKNEKLIINTQKVFIVEGVFL